MSIPHPLAYRVTACTHFRFPQYRARLEARLADGVSASVSSRPYSVITGVDATADSFYSSQGRRGEDFSDFNDGLLAAVESAVPGVASLQMETFYLHDLARASRPGRRIAACGAAIVVWSRLTGAATSAADVACLELRAGLAALDTLAAFALERA